MPTAPLTNMVAGAFDSQQASLLKIVYWLQTAAETLGGTNSYTMLLPSMSANANDSMQSLLVKTAYWAEQLAGGGGSGGVGLSGATVGAGDPPTDGSVSTLFYKDSVTGFKYINLGTAVAPDWDLA